MIDWFLLGLLVFGPWFAIFGLIHAMQKMDERVRKAESVSHNAETYSRYAHQHAWECVDALQKAGLNPQNLPVTTTTAATTTTTVPCTTSTAGESS